MFVQPCVDTDASRLAELRARAMKPSLEALGRFDEVRVRQRFLQTFVAEDTKILLNAEGYLIGFFVLRHYPDHWYLDHFYIDSDYQGCGLGGQVMNFIKDQARQADRAIKLGALRNSRANNFYVEQGFQKTHEDEFDIYYCWQDRCA